MRTAGWVSGQPFNNVTEFYRTKTSSLRQSSCKNALTVCSCQAPWDIVKEQTLWRQQWRQVSATFSAEVEWPPVPHYVLLQSNFSLWPASCKLEFLSYFSILHCLIENKLFYVPGCLRARLSVRSIAMTGHCVDEAVADSLSGQSNCWLASIAHTEIVERVVVLIVWRRPCAVLFCCQCISETCYS